MEVIQNLSLFIIMSTPQYEHTLFSFYYGEIIRNHLESLKECESP